MVTAWIEGTKAALLQGAHQSWITCYPADVGTVNSRRCHGIIKWARDTFAQKLLPKSHFISTNL